MFEVLVTAGRWLREKGIAKHYGMHATPVRALCVRVDEYGPLERCTMNDKPERGTEKYVSPDGSLTFLVVREHGDVSLGFEGTPWHAHADILASLSGLSQEDAVSQFVTSVLEHKRALAIAAL